MCKCGLVLSERYPHTMSSATSRPRSAKRDADRWFREQGLPTFVPLRRWFTDLPRRVAPLIAWVASATFLLKASTLFLDALFDVVTEDDDDLVLAVVVILLLGSLIIIWIVYLLTRFLLRRLPIVPGTIVASLLIAICAFWMIVDGYEFSPGATVGPVFESLLVVAVCILVTGMGGGALVSWASRLAVHNAAAIGHMASIALPVILMVVVFTLFSTEIWQMASALSWGSIALVGLLVAALAALVVLRVTASELDNDERPPTAEQRARMLSGTPAEHLSATAVPRRRLPASQRVNILLAMTFAQLVQALFFAILLGALLVALGSIAIPNGLVELWVGSGNASQPLSVEPVMIGGNALPITVNLLKAAALLSVIATLTFVFSAVSEQRYRERFFDPMVAEMRRAILVRDALDALRQASHEDTKRDIDTSTS
jgi:MFS family permease